jgi:hypothetical protein
MLLGLPRTSLYYNQYEKHLLIEMLYNVIAILPLLIVAKFGRLKLRDLAFSRIFRDAVQFGRWALTPWHESASELYRPSGSRLSAKLVLTFADIGCHVVSVTDPYCRILGFLHRSSYFFFQVAPQLYSRG